MNLFITGAESGIGNEIAFTALQAGHRVFATYLFDKNISHLSSTDNSKNLFLHKLDVTDASQIKHAVTMAHKKLAGITDYNNPASATEKKWKHLFDVNVHGYFLLTKALLPILQQSKNAQIINMSSIWGQQGSADMYSYSVSKHAVEGMSSGLREYCTPLGIKVSNIVLDKVDTDFRENIKEQMQISKEQEATMIQPSDVANTIMYLLNTSNHVLVSTIRLDAFLWR